MRESLATLNWEARLHEVEAEALRFRMAASRLRPKQHHINALRDQVLAALADEATALEMLEAESLRQQKQQQHALKYGYARLSPPLAAV